MLCVVVLEVGVSVVVVLVTGTTLSSTKVFACVPVCTHPVYVTACGCPPELLTSVFVRRLLGVDRKALYTPRANANDVMNRFMCSPPQMSAVVS